MYVVPFPIYGSLSMVTDIEPPSPDSPGLFMLRVTEPSWSPDGRSATYGLTLPLEMTGGSRCCQTRGAGCQVTRRRRDASDAQSWTGIAGNFLDAYEEGGEDEVA